MYGAEGDEKPLLTTFKKVLTSFVLQLSLAQKICYSSTWNVVGVWFPLESP